MAYGMWVKIQNSVCTVWVGSMIEMAYLKWFMNVPCTCVKLDYVASNLNCFLIVGSTSMRPTWDSFGEGKSPKSWMWFEATIFIALNLVDIMQIELDKWSMNEQCNMSNVYNYLVWQLTCTWIIVCIGNPFFPFLYVFCIFDKILICMVMVWYVRILYCEIVWMCKMKKGKSICRHEKNNVLLWMKRCHR